MKFFFVRDARNIELTLKMMITLQLHIPKVIMRTQTQKSQRLLVIVKTYSEQLNGHPHMSIAT